MLIGIDAREIQDGVVTGIGRALDIFLRYFDQLDDEHRCVLFSERPLPIAYGKRCITWAASPHAATLFWDQVTLLRLIRKFRIDIFYSPYYKIPLLTNIPSISTIFDLMYIYYPIPWKGSGRFSRLYYRSIGSLMARKARILFTCSEYSKTEILRFYQVPSEKVRVIHLGLSDRYQLLVNTISIENVKKRLGISSPYLLYTGNFKPHKNVSTLIDAFERVQTAFKEMRLVLAGNRDRHFEALQDRINSSPAAASIIAPGLVTLDEQVALYNGASVFVCPSLYEGFGYPPLEAMACGTAVVSSDRTSLGEIIGEAALRCNPLDANDIADKVIAILRDTTLRQRLCNLGLAQARNFSTAQFCERFYALLLSGR